MVLGQQLPALKTDASTAAVRTVTPPSRPAGALSIWSNGTKLAMFLSDATFVIAAVSVVLPWSTWPIVPTFTWGFVLSNFAFAMFSASCAMEEVQSQISKCKLQNYSIAFGHGL